MEELYSLESRILPGAEAEAAVAGAMKLEKAIKHCLNILPQTHRAAQLAVAAARKQLAAVPAPPPNVEPKTAEPARKKRKKAVKVETDDPMVVAQRTVKVSKHKCIGNQHRIL